MYNWVTRFLELHHSVRNPLSLIVNEYEVDQLEAHEVRLGSDGLTDKKMRICFETFGKILC